MEQLLENVRIIKKAKKCEVSDMNNSTVNFIYIFLKKEKTKERGILLFPTWFYDYLGFKTTLASSSCNL